MLFRKVINAGALLIIVRRRVLAQLYAKPRTCKGFAIFAVPDHARGAARFTAYVAARGFLHSLERYRRTYEDGVVKHGAAAGCSRAEPS